MSNVTWEGWGLISILDAGRSRPAAWGRANICLEDYVSARPQIASEKTAQRRHPAALGHAGVRKLVGGGDGRAGDNNGGNGGGGSVCNHRLAPDVLGPLALRNEKICVLGEWSTVVRIRLRVAGGILGFQRSSIQAEEVGKRAGGL